MTEVKKVYCNVCGGEMKEYSGKYHCKFCEQPDVFGRINKANCWKQNENGEACGQLYGEIPNNYWDRTLLPGKRTDLHRWFTCCKECRSKDANFQSRMYESLAHYFGCSIAIGDVNPYQLKLEGYPEKFIQICEDIAEHWND